MKVTVADKSYRRLREKLTRGELPAGTQLVNRTLAQEFGSSVNPIREAINRLAKEGLITQIAGAGAFVREVTLRDLEEIYVVREAVEGCAAAEAARNIGPRQLEALEETCQQWLVLVREIQKRPDKMGSLEQRATWQDIDERFHTILVAASGNRLLEKIVAENRLVSRIFKATRNVREISNLRGAARSWRDHARLVRALRKRDAKQARVLMVRHIRIGRKTVLEAIRHDQP